MKNYLSLSVTLALAALAAEAHAQQAGDKKLDSVVVTSSPIIESNNVDLFSSFSTRVTESQLKDLSALDLAAGLRMAPGVQISRYNEVGSYSGDQGGNVYIRGMGASRPGSEIKTYLDGIPVYMGVWNHPLMDLLPLNGIKSIDIYKGPQPQSSGNNFGSINLQTKTATREGVEGEVNLSAGSFSTKVLQANLLGRKDDVDFMLAVGQIESDGDRPNSDGRLKNAMGKVGLKVNSAWSVGASFLTVNNEVGDPGDNRFPVSNVGVGPYTFSNGVARNDSATTMFTASVAHKHGDWKGEFKIYDNKGHNDLTNDPNWGTFNSKFKMSGFRWKEEFSPWQGGQIIAGIDQETVSGTVSGTHVGSPVGTPFGFGVQGSAEIPDFKLLSAYAGVSQKINLSSGWMLLPSVGARFYDSNYYESKAGPNAGVSLISDAMTVYANYSRGLLYPGAETYTLTRALPMAFAANNGWDRLSPTEDKHSEIGVKLNLSAATQIDISIFNDEVSDRYVWSGFNAGAFAPPASGTWSNRFPAYRINGGEVSVRHEVNRQWTVFGGLTMLESTISNMPYLPDTAISGGVNGKVGGFKLAFDAQHQSGMYSLTQDRGTFAPNPVAGFTVANARIAYPTASLGKGGEIYVAVNNLFDADYQYNAGYPMPGRNFRVGLIAGF